MRTPDIPGRSTPHLPRLAGLHALQEVVVLLLLAGLLRPVEEAVLGESDLVVAAVARHHVPACLVLQPDPRKGQTIDEDMIELGVVDHHFVGYVRVQIELATVNSGFDFLRVIEGVAHPVVDRG